MRSASTPRALQPLTRLAGQAFNLGGPGEAGGQVNAHYGRDPIVKIYTTITDRYAPLYQTVIAGTAGEAVHTLDGLLGHDSSVDNSLARAVAFHRLGRFRDRGHENQQTRAAALNLVTAAIILFNCRYLGRALGEMRSRGVVIDESLIPQLSPLGWDHINLTGDYVWSDAMDLDGNGFMPLRQAVN